MQQKKRNSLQIMLELLGMIRPLIGFMLLAILMGCVGNLVATFITILGGYGLLSVAGIYNKLTITTIFTIIIIFAVIRGILRYAEQACNHYIAFKLLARIRKKVFASLRRLAPAKLDGNDKGNLISIITSDIELLEVFYAHTISPIAIAIITSIFMCIFMGIIHPVLGLVALIFYLLVGLVVPVLNSRRGSEKGQNYRDSFGELNTSVLDNLYGLEEIIQYGQQEKRQRILAKKTESLEKITKELKKEESVQKISTDWIILFAGITMLGVSGYLANKGEIEGGMSLIATVAMISSFGPTAALSALSNNLNHTLACGNRVLNLLSEEPIVLDNVTGEEECNGDITCDGVTFGYEKKEVLNNFNEAFSEKQIHGILGKSGCGKSTLLKLLMRFYETNQGTIYYGKNDVNAIKTASLRKNISYVTQETFLFHDTIENNIKVAKEDATRKEVIEAAKKASIHDFILSLPNGYDTTVSELGESLSGGERQRIGIARAFLHNSSIIFLDEPTSNIDSLNEGIILRSLEKVKEDKTIILVSHRKSTMGIVDHMINM
jgi:ATP-binding cassette, subfamily C, bacterial